MIYQYYGFNFRISYILQIACALGVTWEYRIRFTHILDNISFMIACICRKALVSAAQLSGAHLV